MWHQLTDRARESDVHAVVSLAAAAEPRCGATVVVAIDGPSGSGKTTLAKGVADDLERLGSVEVVHMDLIFPGWDGLATRGEGDEETAPSDLSDILEDVAAGARRDNAEVSVTWTGDMNVELRPIAIKRCITNLVSNALRHGKRAEVHATRGKTSVEITVDDDGPGIPEARYEDVFRPFVRLDESRNIDTGGSGLGLTIARDIARSHGGDVTLAKSPLGGLRVVVRLPV